MSEATTETNEAMAQPEEAKQMTVEEVKTSLMQNVNALYHNLIGFIRKMPLEPVMVGHAIMNLDQGLMWVEQGIKALKFEVTPPPEGDENVTSTEETTQGQETSKENEVAA